MWEALYWLLHSFGETVRACSSCCAIREEMQPPVLCLSLTSNVRTSPVRFFASEKWTIETAFECLGVLLDGANASLCSPA